MSITSIELGPDTGTFIGSSDERCAWPVVAGHSDRLRTTLGWDLRELGTVAPVAKDLLRIITCAYVADRARKPAGTTLVRDLRLTVHVDEPNVWANDALEVVVDLLHWLTGDDWSLRLTQATTIASGAPMLALTVTAADDISLLSGGLDSYCGALLRHQQPGVPLFLGHADTATAVRAAQSTLTSQLAGLSPKRIYVQHRLHPNKRANGTPKSRSLLFMVMAVAAASGAGARRVLVPENGFTSINPPLEPSRAGVMTTRSTHPWTFHQLTRLLDLIGLGGITVVNPYAQLTKGELVRAALGTDPALLDASAHTVSCAKINAGRPPGGNANLQCGACIACLVRRASYAASGLTDPTGYAITSTKQTLAATTARMRRHDLAAVRTAATGGIPEHRILGAALWPPATDFDQVLDLVHRGLTELSLVIA